MAREESIKKQRKTNRFVEKSHAIVSTSLIQTAKQNDTNIWTNLTSSDEEDDWEKEADEANDNNVFTDTHPNTLLSAVSGDLKVAGSITNQTVCELCDTDLSIEAGVTEDSTIDAIRLANLDIPHCRQCRKVICRSCAENWEQSNNESGTRCPFCRVKHYLSEYVFQCTQLRNAGFDDEEKNILILRQVGGNVNQAIAVLLDEQ